MNDPEQTKEDADTAFRAGQLDDARRLYKEAIATRPGWTAAHNNLAMLLRQSGDVQGAEDHFRLALAADPDQAGILSNLGVLLVEQGRLQDSEAYLQRAVELAPKHAGARYNRSLLYQERGDFDRVIEELERVVSIDPAFAQAHINLGIVLRKLGRLTEAQTVIETALAINGSLFEGHLNLAAVLAESGELAQAITSYRKALGINPNSAEAYYNLGNAYNSKPDYSEALASFNQALTLNPLHKDSAANRAKSLTALGRKQEAYESLRLAMSLDPSYAAAQSNIVFKVQYDPDQTPESLFAEVRQWNTAHAPEFSSSVTRPPGLDPERVLRIGYVSPHFSSHPVVFFIEPVLKHHDPTHVQAFCYADSRASDDLALKLQESAHVWTVVAGQRDEVLADRIAADGIDILIDLDGHSGPNRLPVFAHRAAPLQVTWAGYVGTTGLDAMDYLVTDHRQTVDRDLPFMTEQPVYMPGNYVAIEPRSDAPMVQSVPSTFKGYVTFGCFNTLDKLNEPVIALWAKCLTAVPESRLRLVSFNLGDTAVCSRLEGVFAAHGIDENRLILSGKLPRNELLNAYNDIDIALDPFPYSGGLTTLEALWMGVPVITRKDGDRFASRHSVTHLTAVGHPELIASDADDYMRCAVDLAEDEPRRQTLKESLREQMRLSPVCNGASFTRALENAYRIMWRRYCAGDAPAPIAESDLI